MSTLEDVKAFLSQLGPKDIIFKRHFHLRTKDRPISEGLVLKSLLDVNSLLRAEPQPSRKEESKYKLWVKMSNKYSLVLIIAIRKKNLYIITGWNTYRTWQKAIQK